ncbi:hypothetical protein [Krasilnikovia sp. MM14-A1259]
MSDIGGGSGLAMLMWAHLEDFCQDRIGEPANEAFERFIRWTRSPGQRG